MSSEMNKIDDEIIEKLRYVDDVQFAQAMGYMQVIAITSGLLESSQNSGVEVSK